MSKAKVKVKVSSGKGKSAALMTRVPVTVAKNDNPSGKKMYSTTARTLVSIKTTRGGKSRATTRAR